ncbi:hypothetical protein Scep_013907 [Stephania cephalantha]|uniref:Uncharacterized protein n=1 Tax=Stephania cephalantha TaxID=152367 RepID=A0AAP0J089_9MAGN
MENGHSNGDGDGDGVPENANEHCPGPQSESAGKAEECAGCPNQQECATAPKGPDPVEWGIRPKRCGTADRGSDGIIAAPPATIGGAPMGSPTAARKKEMGGTQATPPVASSELRRSGALTSPATAWRSACSPPPWLTGLGSVNPS